MWRGFKLVRLLGVDIKLHFSFLILFGVLLVAALLGAGSFTYILLLGLVFGFVVLHELGHALAARYYGIRTHSITLLPIGGMANILGEPKEPKEEVVIAVAGPMVNVALAACFGLALWLIPSFSGGWSSLLAMAFQLNLGLAIFNMLPAFPMDGGRVLRALLSFNRHKIRATELAVRVGKTFAVGFGLLGLFINPILALIGVFIWFAGSYELRQLRMRQEWDLREKHLREYYLRQNPLYPYAGLKGKLAYQSWQRAYVLHPRFPPQGRFPK